MIYDIIYQKVLAKPIRIQIGNYIPKLGCVSKAHEVQSRVKYCNTICCRILNSKFLINCLSALVYLHF